jgi:hypothetical protein
MTDELMPDFGRIDSDVFKSSDLRNCIMGTRGETLFFSKGHERTWRLNGYVIVPIEKFLDAVDNGLSDEQRAEYKAALERALNSKPESPAPDLLHGAAIRGLMSVPHDEVAK